MTERDLFCYIRAKNAFKRAEEAFSESLTMYHPPTSTVSFMPKDHSDDIEKVTGKISDKDGRCNRIARAREKVDRALGVLEAVADKLDCETDKNFLWAYYYHGLTYQQIVETYGRSESSLYRDRQRVLSQIKDFDLERS